MNLRPENVIRFVGAAAATLLVLATGGTAAAQYYAPPPPPPPYYAPPPPPPPPPPAYYAPPPPYPYAPPPPPPVLDHNDIRLQAGITGLSSGYYCAPYGYGTACNTYLSYWQLDVRGAWEIRPSNTPGAITLGFDWIPASQGVRAIYEPTVDFGLSVTDRRSKVRSRGYLGFGLPIVENGPVGGLFRLGGGISAPLAPNFAFGLDIVLSLGGINGIFVSGLSFLAGPEVTF